MKKALTIGELLITMAIIGIIAVLVIPGFLKDYHNKLYLSRIKKTYGIVNSAIEQACTDSGVSYFNQTEYAQPNSSTAQQNFLDKYFKVISGSSKVFATKYEPFGEQSESDSGVTIPTAKARLKGGEAIALTCTSSESCTFTVDTNSIDKPNTGGRDLFRFSINTKTNELIYNEDLINQCGTDSIGTGCFESILKENWNMKY